MIAAKYDITAGAHDDFFTAYIAALEQGFSEVVVENSKLISILDEIYIDAVAEVYDAEIEMPPQRN